MRLKPLPRIRNPRIEAELWLQISVTWIQIKVLESLSLKQDIVSHKVKCVFQPQPCLYSWSSVIFNFSYQIPWPTPLPFAHDFPPLYSSSRILLLSLQFNSVNFKTNLYPGGLGSGYFKNEGLWNLRHFLGAGLCKITKNWGQQVGSKVKGTFCQA